MARIIIDDGRTRRRRSNRYPGIFGTIFEFFSICLSGFRLFKRTGRFGKKVTGSGSTAKKSTAKKRS
ncbi:MAG: hypothetical protein J5833_09305 [Victivallales bacterium]|nr:hypothetical protein [Victivallales bacterium]